MITKYLEGRHYSLNELRILVREMERIENCIDELDLDDYKEVDRISRAGEARYINNFIKGI